MLTVATQVRNTRIIMQYVTAHTLRTPRLISELTSTFTRHDLLSLVKRAFSSAAAFTLLIIHTKILHTIMILTIYYFLVLAFITIVTRVPVVTTANSYFINDVTRSMIIAIQRVAFKDNTLVLIYCLTRLALPLLLTRLLFVLVKTAVFLTIETARAAF